MYTSYNNHTCVGQYLPYGTKVMFVHALSLTGYRYVGRRYVAVCVQQKLTPELKKKHNQLLIHVQCTNDPSLALCKHLK